MKIKIIVNTSIHSINLKCFHLTYITINLNIIAETAVWQHAGKIQQSSRQVTLKKKWYRGIAIAN